MADCEEMSYLEKILLKYPGLVISATPTQELTLKGPIKVKVRKLFCINIEQKFKVVFLRTLGLILTLCVHTFRVSKVFK